MMKSITMFVVIALALFLVACAEKTATPEPTPYVPPPAVEPTPPAPEPAAAPAGTGTEIVPTTPGSEKAFGAVNKTTALDVDSVTCDKATKSITFRFKNTDTKDWQLNQAVGWGVKDIAPVRVFVNNYEANGRSQPVYDGQKLFGPNWPMSKNCGDVEVLKPGMDVTCTLSPVPFKSSTALSAGTNEIFVDSPTSHHIIPFTCE